MDLLNGITDTIGKIAPIAESVNTLAPLLMGMGEDIKRINQRHAQIIKHVEHLHRVNQGLDRNTRVDRNVNNAQARVQMAQARNNDRYTGASAFQGGNYEVGGDEMVGGNYLLAGDEVIGGNFQIAGDEIIGGAKRKGRKPSAKKTAQKVYNLPPSSYEGYQGGNVLGDILNMF